ncbi:hypothetical protein [Lactobacillus taiwanensis]|uniref:hypothetical protein n=1 Tax=Lactobacillus taiwanensis TaxID=508451 RepID=UPI0032208B78
MTNSKEFDQKLQKTGSVFKVDMVNDSMFKVIQEHRSILSIPLELDRVKDFSSKLACKQLYLTTDMPGLYLFDEKTLKMHAIYLDLFTSVDEAAWIDYITNEKNSIEYMVEREGDMNKLAHDLVNSVIIPAEKSQRIVLFEILLDRVSGLINDTKFQELKQMLIILTRKELDVFFEEFDGKFTSQLSYRYNNTEKITIYRGENSRSQSYEKTFSWTTSKEVAIWFATRFNDSKLLSSTVAKNNLLYIYEDDPESEVLVRAADLNNVTAICVGNSNRVTE